MLASLRAELLILRKSKVAWALVLVAPLLTLITVYLFGFLAYLGDTPAHAVQYGSPAMTLPGLLPSQFAIQTLAQLGFTAPFIVLGAVIAGGDWGHGTIKAALLAGPGRARTFAGQAVAILIACAVSVLLSFALAALASVAIRGYVGPHAPGAAGNSAFPAWAVIGEGIGAGLLIGLTYGALGIALGTACRSAAGGVAAALAWYFLIDDELYGLSVDAGGALQHVYNAFPEASVITMISMFGSAGGGASSATYQPVSPWGAAAILLGYAAGFLLITLVLVLRRDIVTAAHGRSRRPARASDGASGRVAGWARALTARPRPALAAGEPDGAGGPGGVLAAARAELLVMWHWPAMWAFVLILPVVTLFDAYLGQFVLYLNAGSGAIILSSPGLVLPTILPGQYVPAVLNSVAFDSTLSGTAAFFLIGALAGGSSWDGGTIRTALLQAPGRARTAVGQALAVAAALVASAVLTFLAAGVCTTVIALAVTGSASPAAGPLPGLARLAGALGITVVVALAWGGVGWATGIALKSAVGAFAIILFWTTVVQLQLNQYATMMPKVARAVYDVLPDAATDTVALLFGQVNYGGPGAEFGEVAPLLAFATLALYALACFALPVILTRRRDVM